MERDYYPPGAYNDPDAPYNQRETPEVEVEAEVTVLMKGTFVISTDQYCEDEDGDRELLIGASDIEAEIKDQCTSLPSLLRLLGSYINDDLKRTDISPAYRSQLKEWLAAAEGWEQTDMEVEDYNLVK